MRERDPGPPTRTDAPLRAESSTAHEPTGLSHYAGLVRGAIPPMHPGGRPIVAGVGAAALLARLLTGRGTLLGLAATAAVAAFFREPARVTPDRAGVVVAPADGTVATVEDAGPPAELGLPATPLPRVSVFLSVLDVHVQRIPCDGRVERVVYRPGKFLSADLDKASEDNERSSMLLRAIDGHRIGVVQIAGLLARRIVCQVGEGAEVTAGETYGLIRFGSRVDTYLPAGSRVLVAPGQRVIGGETVLAELPAQRESAHPAPPASEARTQRDPHRHGSNQPKSAHPAPPASEATTEAETGPGEA